MPENQFFKNVQNRAWALLPAKLEEISLFIEKRLVGEKVEFPESAIGKSGNKADDAFDIRDGVAILPVYGIIDKRMNLIMQWSGGTSTELLARDFNKALNDPQVKAILLDIDSPGGSVDGTADLADLILSARGQKPVVAYANGLMASAAYWIGSAAEMVIAGATAEVGSIGVALMHYDYSAADEKEGLKRTVITGGKFKRIASDEKPLSKEGREYLQATVDDYYGLFLEGVARQRGVDPETVHTKMADGRIFVGKKAMKAGLIDQIGNLTDALALARARGGAMPKNITKAVLQAENPELFQEILADGAAAVTLDALVEKQPQAAEQFRAEGIATERARVMEILEAGGDAQVAVQAVKDGTAVQEAFKLLLRAEKQGRAKSLEDLAKAAPPLVGGEPPKVETHKEPERGDLPIEKQALKEWDDKEAGPKLQQEFFGKFETYLAYRRAETAGQITK